MIIVPLTYIGEVQFTGKDGKDVSCSQFVFFNNLDVYYCKSIPNLEKGKEYKCIMEISGKKFKVKEIVTK